MQKSLQVSGVKETGRGDCDGLQAKGKMIKISGFLPGFYIKLLRKVARENNADL